MQLTDRLVLPSEVLVFPVDALAPAVRSAIGCDPDDYAVTRRRSRRTTRLINRASADLLNEFRRPTSIVEAVQRFTESAGVAPEEVVEACLPMLAEMVEDGFIVPLGSEEPSLDGDLLRAGDRVGGWEILEPLQRLDDSDVYRVAADDGTEAVLKRVLGARDLWVLDALRNERDMLGLLAGTSSPAVLEDGTDADPAYLVLSFCEGQAVSTAAAELRRPWSPPARRRLAELCAAVLDAYVALHARDVLHGDVHPHNLLYDRGAGVVHPVDFGLAADLTGGVPPALGGGVPMFVAPEVAAARLVGDPEPPPTVASEQYAVATLLFGLLTGHEPLPPALEERAWLERVRSQAPRAFSGLAMPPSPAVEGVLRRALAKDPVERFGSLAALRDAFAAAATEDLAALAPASPVRAWSPPGLFDAVARRLASNAEHPLARPTATINQGAAGIALFLYRASCVLDRADLLAAADVWIERARAAIAASPADACFDPRTGLDAASIGTTGLYHSAIGVHSVDALIACVTDDRPRAGRAIEAFIAAAQGDPDRDDLVTGRAGHLLASALLLEAVRAAGYGEQPLLVFGRRRRDELLAAWSTIDSPVRGTREAFLGVAHGWSGLAYPLLAFATAAREPTPAPVTATLDQLTAAACRDGDRAWWPRTTEDETPWGGWCNGSAGHALLWAQAHRSLGDERALELAAAAAEDAWAREAGAGHLCCGAAGQAYAQLCLHRHTGDGRYADRARALLDRAVATVGGQGMLRDSLYKGDVGVALLEAELTEPFWSAMPLFESEGWPPSG